MKTFTSALPRPCANVSAPAGSTRAKSLRSPSNSQMAGVGSVDQDYQPATRFDSWLDMRCQPYIDWMECEAGDKITRITGCPPTCDHGPKMLWWKNERLQDYQKIVKFVMPAAYVAGKMAGLKGDQAYIDYTFIHFSGFADAQKTVWSDELCRTFGLDQEKLPRIVAPWEVIGEVSPAAAADFGLAPGTIIAAGAGDTAVNALGAGIVRPGMLFDVAGTAAVLAGCTDAFVADEQHRTLLTMRSVIPGLWNPLAYIAGGGIALRWFRDQFYNTFRGQSLGLPDGDLYGAMTQWIEHVPAGSDGLLFSPHLGGRICPADPQMRGAWLGFSWGHTQAYFLRSLLEGVAYEYAGYLNILRELLPGLQLIEARVVGGGAHSPAWNQIKADVLGVPYRRLAGNEFGTWGAAMLAGKAAGLFDDLAAKAGECAHPSGAPCLPNPANQAVYRPLVKKYAHMEAMAAQFFADTNSASAAADPD